MDKNQNSGVPDLDSVRKKLKNRNSVDFSNATLRRLALLFQNRDHR